MTKNIAFFVFVAYGVSMEPLAENVKIEYSDNLPVNVELFSANHYPAHYHESTIEVLLCLEGSATIKSCNTVKLLHPGDIFSMDSSDIHCIFSDKDNLLMSLHIDTQHPATAFADLNSCFIDFDEQMMNHLQVEPMFRILDCMISIGYLLADNNNNDSESICKQGIRIADLLSRYFDWLAFIPDPYYSNRQFHERCKRIMAYCLENFREKITISQVAEMEHINENYLSAFMKRTSLGGFKNSVNFIRSFYGEQLLLTTDYDVIDISSQCGFSDPKYFYTYFKKTWGCTPAKHRKWYREYAAQKPDFRILADGEIIEALDRFLPGYHLRKTAALTDIE